MNFTTGVVSLAARVREKTGRQRRLAAFAAGGLSNLAMAPVFAWPVLWLTLAVLVWLADGALAEAGDSAQMASGWSRWRASRVARAAAVGWWFGFGYFFFGLFWIGEAFLVEAEIFAWLLPFAIIMMPSGLALFYALALALAAASANLWDDPVRRIGALALAFSGAEWLRGHVLSGFPWNVLGYALTAPDTMMQSAGLLGIYGLTLVAIIVFAAPLVLWEWTATRAPGPAPRMRWTAALAALLPLAIIFAWGTVALRRAQVSSGLAVRLVQPSIPQREKWRPENQRRIFEDHLDLSRRAADGTQDDLAGIDLVVWPEAAMPFLPLETPEALAAIGRLLPSGTVLLTGALRREAADPARGLGQRAYNSLLAFGAGGRLLASYDKVHLVPFGEYLPARPVLEAIGLQQLTRQRGGFATGLSPRPPMTVATRRGQLTIGPLICYEAIFPAAIVQTPVRPDVLVNVTNDGWFGNTTGPRQHFHQTRVRAVEEGLAIVRVANNGISALIDPTGRVVARLDLDVRGSASAVINSAGSPTPYALYGDNIYFMMFAFLLLLMLAGRRMLETPAMRAFRASFNRFRS